MVLRLLTSVALFGLVLSAASAEAWDIEWIDQFGNSVFTSATGGKTDSTGIYVGGTVVGALPGQSAAGGADAYLLKSDSDGQVVWTRQFGTSSSDLGLGVATDSTGIYLAGRTGGTLPGHVTAGGSDVFVRKFSPGGDVIWTRQFGTSQFDTPLINNGIASHSTGVYVAGITRGTFPGQPAGTGDDKFLARFHPATGDLVWVRQFGLRGLPTAVIGGVGADDTGIYVASNFQPTEGERQAFLRKYDFDGNLVWTRELPHPLQCGISFWGIATHARTLYVVGQADESFVTDPERCVPPFPGSAQVGVLRAYDGDGTLLWTRRIKGGARTGEYQFTGAKTVWASAAGVFVAANLTTTFPGTLPDGSRSDRSECSGVELGNPFFDQLDAYVRRYDFNGDVIWTHQFGSNVFDIVSSLGTDATSVYAVGDTSCRVDEGETLSGGTQDSFVVRIALEPTSPSGLIQLIVGRLETLSDRTRLGPGEFNSLIQDLEAALAALQRGDSPVARQSLEVFIGRVELLRSHGTLSSAEADPLVSAANDVIAKL